jgi:hypothetical protein
VLIILASRHDPTAPWLADEWAGDEAVVLTCEDLSCAGWEHDVAAPERGSIVVGGRRVAQSMIRAVLTLLPSVSPHELPDIVDEDREYVAQEAMAFLLAWLAALGPRAVNRPTPYCLMGPHWRAERWLKVARELGLATVPVTRKAAPGVLPFPPPAELMSVTVVGQRAFLSDGSTPSQTQCDTAIRLARAAGAELLAVRLTAESAVVDAHLWPDLRLTAVLTALRDHLLRAAS